MRFTVQQDKFKKALGYMNAVVPPHPSLPVLAYIKMDAADGSVVLTGTNLETVVSVKLEAEVVEAGVWLVPGSVLYGMVLHIKDEEVSLELDKKAAQLRLDAGGTYLGQLKVLPVEEFPKHPVPEGVCTPLSVKPMLASLPGLIATVAKDTVRHALMGVFFDLGNGRLELASTDGCRLVHCKLQIELDARGPLSPDTKLREVAELKGIKNKTWDALEELGIQTIGQAVGTAPEDLMAAKGVARKTADKLLAVC